MAQTLPYSISDFEAEKKAGLRDIFLKPFERRHFVEKAVIWGLLVVLVGIAVDYLTYQFHWPWLRERIVVNSLQGGLFALFIWVCFKVRLNRRFREIGYLNHHIRNSLTTIKLAEFMPESDQRLEIIREATTRIERCVEKITRNEDLEIDEQYPDQP